MTEWELREPESIPELQTVVGAIRAGAKASRFRVLDIVSAHGPRIARVLETGAGPVLVAEGGAGAIRLDETGERDIVNVPWRGAVLPLPVSWMREQMAAGVSAPCGPPSPVIVMLDGERHRPWGFGPPSSDLWAPAVDLEEVRPAMPPPSDPTVRRLRARVAASSRWANEDPRDPDGPLPRARAAFDARFYEGIPDDVSPQERERRAGQARKAYFASLSLKSVMARKRRAVADRQGGDAA